jgi:acetyl-CoA carboxylase biotin carboxyl carrier protein
MFTFEELCALIRVVSETRVGGVEVERDGVRYRVDGIPPAPAVPAPAPLPPAGGPSLVAPQAAVAAAQTAPLPAASAPAPAVVPEESEEELAFVTSPIVGTFYRAPNPEAEPYVKVGDRVSKGQVLCIVEAMKLMNEIESDTAGVIVKIYPENAQPVEFGERLFAIRPS